MYTCTTCTIEIPEKRVEYYQSTDYPENIWTCVKCSTVKKPRGIYMGESGTSELKIVSKVYDDSVSSIFEDSSKEETEE